MPRVLFVVARDRGELFGHLQEQFADVADRVEVVYDRRLGERRQRDLRTLVDRRVVDRRAVDIREQLTSTGWAFVSRGRSRTDGRSP